VLECRREWRAGPVRPAIVDDEAVASSRDERRAGFDVRADAAFDATGVEQQR
jgi:hypothetical protein